MKHSVEITEEAALLLIGNDEESFTDYHATPSTETSFYSAYGVVIAKVYNFDEDTIKFLIQDINSIYDINS
jgi:hypothetical protein